MQLIIRKTTRINGKISPPASKSESIRAIILASMAEGESTLTNVLQADDIQDAIKVCQAFGADIVRHGNIVQIKSEGTPFRIEDSELTSGNSGITTHFTMPILGLRDNAIRPIILNCAEQMRARPIRSLVDALKNLGLNINYLNQPDTLPIKISGELTGGNTFVDGSTSQYLSALLFALPCAKKDSEIRVKNLQERPYVEMTLNYLKAQNIQFSHLLLKDTDIYTIKGNQTYQSFNSMIPNDFSSASYIIAAAALIPGETSLQGLNMDEPQGDKRLITLLQEMGADIDIQSDVIIIHGGKRLSGMDIDAREFPDLLPTLAVIGTFASGKTEIFNVAHARIKETDRIHSMYEGLIRMGVKIEEKSDSLTIYQSSLKGNHLKGYGDHRSIMALSIAGLLATGETIIDDAEATNKTFPTFVETMQSLGANMEMRDASHS